MVSAELRSELVALTERVWELAKRSLDEGESQAYRSLVDIAERVKNLVPPLQNESSEGVNPAVPSASIVEIFAGYKGKVYTAELDTSRIVGRSGECVRYQGKRQTVSAAACSITGTQVNGWRSFWKYRRPDGIVAAIDELRRMDKTLAL